jgi:hypothetical protein
VTKKLCEIPTSEFPFNRKRFNLIADELIAAEKSFRDLHRRGYSPVTRMLADEIERVHLAVVALWGHVLNVEEAEKEVA